MTEDHDAQLAKIQALLAKAESTTFPEEAKALTAKAFSLMQKWSIDEAMLAHGRKVTTEGPDSTRIEVPYSPFKGPKQDLLVGLARLCDCRPILTSMRIPNRRDDIASGKYKGKYRHIGHIDIIGFPQDRRFCEMLYTSLLLQAEVEFLSPEVQEQMADECSHPGHRTKWRNTFQDGFNSEVLHRIRKAKTATRSDAEKVTPGTGLVLASKQDQVNNKVAEIFPKLHKAAGSNRGFAAGSAYQAGTEAGRRADVGGTKVSEGKGGARGVKGAAGTTSLGSLLP